jgi:hypothetical protein
MELIYSLEEKKDTYTNEQEEGRLKRKSKESMNKWTNSKVIRVSKINHNKSNLDQRRPLSSARGVSIFPRKISSKAEG